jgi:cob(I)alamin adenosyltransferase
MSTSNKQKLFSGLGDGGETGLIGEGRFNKSDRRFEVIGSIDELSAVIGIVKAQMTENSIQDDLSSVQRILYSIMSEISYLDPDKLKKTSVTQNSIDKLEGWIDRLGSEVNLPAEFILPGDTVLSAYIDFARTYTRRVERSINGYMQSGEIVNPFVLKFINRLSSYFYVLEINHLMNQNNGKFTLAKD